MNEQSWSQLELLLKAALDTQHPDHEAGQWAWERLNNLISAVINSGWQQDDKSAQHEAVKLYRDAVEELICTCSLSINTLIRNERDPILTATLFGVNCRFLLIYCDLYLPSAVHCLVHSSVANPFDVIHFISYLYHSNRVAACVVPALEKYLASNGHEVVRYLAVNTLGYLGSSASESVPSIALLLDDAKWSVRSAAARALGRVGVAALRFSPRLRTMARTDQSQEVRIDAVLALEDLRVVESLMKYVSVTGANSSSEPGTRKRKRKAGIEVEYAKSLLALLDVCVAWPENEDISPRRLEISPLLRQARAHLGLPKRNGNRTIDKHLKDLALMCGIAISHGPPADLTQLDEKRQHSRLREGVRASLTQLRPRIEAKLNDGSWTNRPEDKTLLTEVQNIIKKRREAELDD